MAEKVKKSSPKAIQISKEQASMITIIGVATVITVFCLMSSKALLSQAAYQAKVINARHKSAKQLNDDISNANTLVNQYNNVFIGNGASNIIGGANISDPLATPPNGDNGKIVLDALPTVYDFPALLTSMSKILTNDSIGSPSIGGTDQTSTIKSDPTATPAPANIDMTISGTGTYQDVTRLLSDFERSIRPFDITHLTLNGNESSLNISMNITTYYQPAKTLNISSQEIK